ncbi:hypothetical protein JS561_03905 [Salmonella enterica subsp. enterica serovar Infantis]|nr:hypothetical protein JS561_03905 [Salmonella enterica subsp. enterica serovar Infantis]
MATEFNKRVLIVDYDPQCNSTQLIMGIEESAEFYTRSNNKISTIKMSCNQLKMVTQI